MIERIDREVVANIERYLYSTNDDKKREWMRRVAHTEMPLLGGRVPTMRRIAREIVRSGQSDAFLDLAPCTSYESVLLRGLVMVESDMDARERRRRIREYLDDVDSWAHVDFVAEYIDYRDRAYYDFLLEEMRSHNEWHVRYGVVAIMDYYFGGNDCRITLDEALSEILSLDIHTYYIDMAIAWAISVAYVHDERVTLDALDAHIQPANIVRYAIGKVRDSYRVNSESKATFREHMRRYL